MHIESFLLGNTILYDSIPEEIRMSKNLLTPDRELTIHQKETTKVELGKLGKI